MLLYDYSILLSNSFCFFVSSCAAMFEFFEKLTGISAEKSLHFDSKISRLMAKLGHIAEKWLLGLLFVWFGSLKVLGQFSASSIIAKSVYLFDPDMMVRFLGLWELAIGVFLLLKGTRRIAILLIVLRVPGTLLALILKYDVCFEGNIFLPTLQGQYLLKDLTLLGAAFVLGGAVREKSTS